MIGKREPYAADRFCISCGSKDISVTEVLIGRSYNCYNVIPICCICRKELIKVLKEIDKK